VEEDPSLRNSVLPKIVVVKHSKYLKCRRPEVNLDRQSAGATHHHIKHFKNFTLEDWASCASKNLEGLKPKSPKCRRPEVNMDCRSTGGYASSDQAFQEFYFGGLCELCIKNSQRDEARSPEALECRSSKVPKGS
jgi:hypothetical protein